VHDSFKVYARDLKFVSACIFGGVGMNPQVQAMSKGVDVLVACPGRLLDLAGQGSVDLSHVEILVLDEADRMLDMGFIHDVKKVLAPAGQAPEPAVLGHLLQRHHRPGRQAAAQPGAHRSHAAEHHGRAYRAARLPPARQPQARAAGAPDHPGAWEQVLVFTRTKHGANRLAEYLGTA
jgi:ATP-dependent RNA helicase RhlE